MKKFLKFSGFLSAILCPQLCLAVGSAELYSSKAYGYGRIETRARFAPGDGVVGSFFLWKDGSEKAGTFWNELDFEKINADCRLQSNPIYGNPSANHGKQHALEADFCGAFHTYAYEWTPEAIVWLFDGVEIRRETGATATAFAENASAGMQIHFNVWPGDATFGGNFNPSILPVHQYIDWVQFSAYEDGAFKLSWREDFNASTVPDGWLTGSWPSPKNRSTHAPENVNFINGYAVLSLTADDALGATGAVPEGSGGAGAVNGAAGSSGSNSASGGTPGSSGSASSAAGAGAVTAAGAVGVAGSLEGSEPPPSTGSGCSIGPSARRGASWWTIGVSAMALLFRRARRTRAA